MKTKNISLIIFISIAVLAVVLGITTYLLYPDIFGEAEDFQEINSYEECVEAGYPVIESYPEQCATPDGKTFTKELEDWEETKINEENRGYYGQSTFGKCEKQTECVVDGCNGEICRSTSEGGMASICIEPDLPTPDEIGYNCECINNKCQWSK